jgi:6-phosphogluconolactonase/glucosamine-6-phosphate isomerase/deaminase
MLNAKRLSSGQNTGINSVYTVSGNIVASYLKRIYLNNPGTNSEDINVLINGGSSQLSLVKLTLQPETILDLENIVLNNSDEILISGNVNYHVFGAEETI